MKRHRVARVGALGSLLLALGVIATVFAQTAAAQDDWSPPSTVWVEGAGHTCGAVHPWQGAPPALEQVEDTTLAFFAEHLR